MPAAIDRQRQIYVATIRQARALGEDGNPLLDKAQNLLTSHWGDANWSARVAILKTVDWLLRVALHNPLPEPRARHRMAAASSPGVRRPSPPHH